MAKKARKRASAGEAAAEQGMPALDKIAGLLALIATHDMDKDSAALRLDGIGFTAGEIASLLDVGTNYIQVARFRKRNAGRKSKKRKA
jgi:hypothetical protein